MANFKTDFQGNLIDLDTLAPGYSLGADGQLSFLDPSQEAVAAREGFRQAQSWTPEELLFHQAAAAPWLSGDSGGFGNFMNQNLNIGRLSPLVEPVNKAVGDIMPDLIKAAGIAVAAAATGGAAGQLFGPGAAAPTAAELAGDAALDMGYAGAGEMGALPATTGTATTAANVLTPATEAIAAGGAADTATGALPMDVITSAPAYTNEGLPIGGKYGLGPEGLLVSPTEANAATANIAAQNALSAGAGAGAQALTSPQPGAPPPAATPTPTAVPTAATTEGGANATNYPWLQENYADALGPTVESAQGGTNMGTPMFPSGIEEAVDLNPSGIGPFEPSFKGVGQGAWDLITKNPTMLPGSAMAIMNLLNSKNKAGMMGDLNTAQQQSYKDYTGAQTKNYTDYLNAINPPADVKSSQFNTLLSNVNTQATLAAKRTADAMAARGVRGRGTAAPSGDLSEARRKAASDAYNQIYGKFNVPSGPLNIAPGPANYAPSTGDVATSDLTSTSNYLLPLMMMMSKYNA